MVNEFIRGIYYLYLAGDKRLNQVSDMPAIYELAKNLRYEERMSASWTNTLEDIFLDKNFYLKELVWKSLTK